MFENAIHKLDECTDVYDLIALAVSLYDRNAYATEKLMFKGSIMNEKKSKLHTILINYQMNLENFGVFFAWPNFITQLKKLNMNTMESVGYKMLVTMLDASILNVTQMPQIGDNICMSALNVNVNETDVCICPKSIQAIRDKMKSANFKLRKPIGNNTHDFTLKHVNVFYKKEIDPYHLNFIYRKNKNVNDAKKEYTFAICPFTNKNIEDIFQIDGDEDVFWIDSETAYGASNEYQNRYLDQLDKLLDTDADFIVFPEMLLTETIIKQLSLTIKKHKILEDRVIVCGTNSKKGENRCYVFDNYGKEIFIQNKITSFETKDGRKELLKSNNVIHILMSELFGTIFLSICKDINNDYIKKFIIGNEVDLLFVDAFSNSMDINSSATDVTKNIGCISVLCNSCGAFNSHKQDAGQFYKENIDKVISYVNVPGLNGTARACACHELKIGDKCSKCTISCSPFLIKVSLHSYNTYGGIKTCKVEQNRL